MVAAYVPAGEAISNQTLDRIADAVQASDTKWSLRRIDLLFAKS